MAARSLVGKFSKLIALLMPQWQEDQSSLIFSHYAGSLIGALDLFVRRAGYFSMLCSFRNVDQAMSFQGNWRSKDRSWQCELDVSIIQRNSVAVIK